MESFIWRGITFAVKLGLSDEPVFRDAAHFGGPWSDVSKALANKSLYLSFRRALEKLAQP